MDDDYFDEETMLNWIHNTGHPSRGIDDLNEQLGLDTSSLPSVGNLDCADTEHSEKSKSAGSDHSFELVAETPEPLLSNDKYQSALRSAVSSTRSFDSGLKQPWEKGPMKFLFGNSLDLSVPTSMSQPVPSVLNSAGSVTDGALTVEPLKKKSKTLSLKDTSFIHCVKHKPDQHYLEKYDADKKLAVGKIHSLICMKPEAFSLGRVVLEETDTPMFEAALMENLDVVLSMKSPKTVSKRAGSLLLFSKWSTENNRGCGFPITETDVAAYLFALRRSGQFTSRGSTFREALRFSHYILGLDGALGACDSSRVKGASDLMLTAGGTWSPADPFLVSEVIKFHNILDSDEKHTLDRIAAGNTLVMIYGRCRASDLSFIKTVKLDYTDESGYLELGTQHHKTAKKATLKTKLLPIVLPVIGINGKNWVKTLIGLRKKTGLACDDLHNAPWWPAPLSVDGDNIAWGLRPVSSDEIAVWMNACLGTAEGDKHIGSHSAKSTCLSWLSKTGVPREDRDVLGCHVSALHGAGPLYARDLLSSPLRKFEETIASIFGKQFMPDQSRSGMFTPVAAAPATPVVINVVEEKQNANVHEVEDIKEETVSEVIEVHDSADEELGESEISVTDAESDGSTNSDDEDEQLEAILQARAASAPMPIRIAEGCLFFMHKKSKICHFRRRELSPGGGPNFFECGRMLSDNFDAIPSISTNSFRCGLCFKSRKQQ